METILWVIGILIALAIAHIYYRLSLSKSLSFFLLLDDQPLSRIDPNVRSRLRVQFFNPEGPPPNVDAPNEVVDIQTGQHAVIQALHHLQIIVANTGVKAISFTESPVIDIPAGKSVLDASIIHQRPLDLGASLARMPVKDDGIQKLSLSVKLLNRREYFIVKLLLSDVVNPSDLKVHLLAEDLERTISVKRLPANTTKSVLEALEWTAIWLGAVLSILVVALYFVASKLYELHPIPSPLDIGFGKFFLQLTFEQACLIGAYVGVAVFGFISAVLFFGIGLQSLTNWKRIILPAELRPPGA